MEKINNRDLLYKKTVVSPIDVIGILDDDFAADPLLVIHKIINKYNKKIYQGFINEKIINGFYTVLCYEYNLKIDSTVSTSPAFDKSIFKNIVKYINENYEKEPREFIKIFYEIIVLQLKLYCSESELSNLCQDFIEHQSSIKDNNTDIYYQVIECFVDALWLKGSINHQELMGVCLLILEEVTCWFKKIERTDWKLFISLIMKILQVFDHKIILESLWMMMSGSNDWEKSLTLLSILIDDILALPSDEMSSLNRDYCCAETLWQLISQGLRSPVEQYRKQGLYCMKTILDFLETCGLPPTVSSIPFIRCPKYRQEPAIKDLKSKFFLIMESLEEKQAHLVTPVLGHLERLIQLHVDHQSCANCFDSKWVQCIFERVLSHKTNGVIKSGVITLLQMDPRIYNEDLVTLLLNSLNATFIYDNPTPEPEPLVVKELAELFVKAEYSQVALINQFVFLASTISWTPIPLFYVMSSLCKAGHMLNYPVECNAFTENELNSLETITDKYLNTQTLSLRNFFRDLIATVIFHFSIEPSLDSIAKIYHLFTRNQSLHHSSISYCLLHKYIKNKLSIVAADDYVVSGCKSLSDGKKINVKSFAQMMAILYDAGKIFPSSGCSSVEAFSTTVNSLINLESRPYADKNNYQQAISLLSHFLNYFVQYDGHDDHKKMIYNKFILHIKSVLAFVVKTSKQTDNSLMEVEIYTQCFQVILKFFKKCDWFCPNDIWDYFNKIEDDTRQIIDQQSNDSHPINKIKLLFGLNILASIAEVYSALNGLALKPMINLCQRPLNSSDSQSSDDRKVASDCYLLIAKIFHCLLANSIQLDDNQEVLLSFVKLVDWGKESVVCPVMKSLKSLVERRREFLIKDVSLIKSLVDDSWVNLWEMKRDSLFWETSICFIDCLMAIEAYSDCLSMGIDVKDYVDKINSRSQDIVGLKSLLWHRFRIPATKAIDYWELIISNFVDANSGRGDRKMEQQTHVFLLNNFSFKYCYYSNRYLDDYKNIYIDAFLRAELIFLFIAPVKANPDLFPEREDRVISILLSTLKAHQGKRYYGDSSLHRVKHRVMQLLLVIHPCLEKESLVVIHDVIGECLIVESNQPTVRMMQEWLLIKLYLDYPEMVNKLWGLLERAKEERPGSITSIASIIYHVSKNISDENQQLFIKDAIYKLLSCAFSQQFVVRLYCQTVLSKLFDMIPSSDISNYDNLKKSIDESLLRGNMYKNSIKLSEDFYFTKFDPIKNYTLTTIFYDVPRLLNMAKDEWLLPEVLKEIFVNAPYEYERNIHISINNEHTLENLTLSSQMTKTRCQELDEEDSSSDSAADIQKKMIPWKSIIPFDADSTGITTLRHQKLADDAGLIVVASLIDSMANLGGLARTAEIFCAKQLVLGNMKYMENKEFQVLSVSAEKWVQITEVKAHELRDYLLEKSSLGWKIVGAEQTANSVCLTDMEFDKKTVLVLGNEKSGMPANLIPLMDVCVEIPQAGVVRSLNVHVTGAICMWQYAQQYIFK